MTDRFRVWWDSDAVTWRVDVGVNGALPDALGEADTFSHGCQIAAEHAGRPLGWSITLGKDKRPMSAESKG